ncbi:hypothetical protein [Nocardia amamiensis]|uniref:hypothetical protein n=1 Tax=Nocardia amamiensis TaxID=404578 RepID=UPI0033DD80F3
MSRYDDVETLRELVEHRHVVEILDALSRRAQTLAELRSTIGGRWTLPHAVRVVAGRGLVTAEQPGSWDDGPAQAGRLILTESGRRTVDALSSVAAWTALYEQSALEPDS